MPNERNPPPQVPVRTYPTPDITDQVLVEWVTSQHANSHPVLPGTPHEVSREFPGFKLGKQDVNPRDENWFIRYWVMDQPTDSENQRDFWNYAIKFAEESNIHPLYIRSYRISKDGYEPLAKGTLDPSGTPNLYLVSEEAKQFPETSEFFADYFNVIRVFETLPGPYTCTTQVNDEEKVVTVCTRRNLVANVPGATATEAGGIITETFSKQVDSVTSEESTSTRQWLDKTSYEIEIPILIPEWARPQIPIITESHTLAGVASQPVLGNRELRAREAQVSDLLYQRTVTKIRDDVVFPVTAVNEQTDERYGGAVLEERLTLDEVEMNADEGFLIVDSKTTTLAVYTGGPPDGLFMKTTLLNPGDAWPILLSLLWDDEMQVLYDREEQIVEAPYSVATPSVGDNFVETREEIDQWRDRRIKITKNPTAVDVSTALQDVQGHPYQFPGWLAPATYGYYVRKTRADLTEHVIRTWWITSATRPTTGATGSGADVEYDPIIMDNIIISTLNNVTTLAYSGECLHDDLTTFGTLFWPETTPNKTTYVGTWIGTERVITAEVKHTLIPFLWKAQTISVVMR